MARTLRFHEIYKDFSKIRKPAPNRVTDIAQRRNVIEDTKSRIRSGRKLFCNRCNRVYPVDSSQCSHVKLLIKKYRFEPAKKKQPESSKIGIASDKNKTTASGSTQDIKMEQLIKIEESMACKSTNENDLENPVDIDQYSHVQFSNKMVQSKTETNEEQDSVASIQPVDISQYSHVQFSDEKRQFQSETSKEKSCVVSLHPVDISQYSHIQISNKMVQVKTEPESVALIQPVDISQYSHVQFSDEKRKLQSETSKEKSCVVSLHPVDIDQYSHIQISNKMVQVKTEPEEEHESVASIQPVDISQYSHVQFSDEKRQFQSETSKEKPYVLSFHPVSRK